MVRFSLSDLEEALSNPVEYLRRQTGGGRQEFIPRRSYYTVLRNAIFKFHNTGDNPTEGRDYLVEKLAHFKDEARTQDTMAQLEWYMHEYQHSNLIAFSWRENVVIRPSVGSGSSLEWSGQVSRLDIRPTGGYAAWVFRSNSPAGWFNELRMPLIQSELSNGLNAPFTDISMGIYSFRERFADHRCYSAQSIADAQRKLQDLGLALGL